MGRGFEILEKVPTWFIDSSRTFVDFEITRTDLCRLFFNINNVKKFIPSARDTFKQPSFLLLHISLIKTRSHFSFYLYTLQYSIKTAFQIFIHCLGKASHAKLSSHTLQYYFAFRTPRTKSRPESNKC